MDKTINKSKEDLIAEIERRVEDKIIEKSNADLIIKLIKNSDSLSEAISIAQLGTTYKRTGFHFDKRLEKMDNTIKYFKKNEALSFINDTSKLTHKLIIGDNYDALLNLLVEYRNKIDVIYIDPPYGKNDLGEFAKTNYDNAITRDNLLSMMYSRLKIARDLMTNEGIIFCSIDDKNLAYVKCLFDEIFGEYNFVAQINNISGANQAGEGVLIQKNVEYCLVYTKNKDCAVFNRIDKTNDSFRNLNDAPSPLSTRLDMGYTIYYNESTGDMIPLFDYDKNKVALNTVSEVYTNDESLISKGYVPVRPGFRNGYLHRWRWGIETFKNRIDEIKIFKQGEYYIPKFQQKGYNPPKNIQQFSGGATELKKIFGEKTIFDYPKGLDFMKFIINISTDPDDIVLDFFAGSGTTGHAVMQLNKEDGGNRTFILCTNNEITDLNLNGIATDVTSKRLKRIMSGECYDGYKEFDWIKNNEPYGDNLDVYEIEKVANFESSEGKTPFDVIDETLYGLSRFTSIKDKIEWVCNNFEHTQKNIESDEAWKERLESK